MSKVVNDNYIVIQGWMVNDLQLKGNELMVYAIIYGFSQDGLHWFKGSRQYLADWTNSTKQGIGKNLVSLVEKGLLEKQDRIMNGVKFVDYRATQFTTLGNKIDCPEKQSLPGGGKQSLPHNIDIDNLEDISKDNKNMVNELFEELWMLYPKKLGKSQVSKKAKKAIYDIGYEQMSRAISRYAADNKNTDPQYIKYGSTFFNGGYVDYLDENYVPPAQPKSKAANDLDNFYAMTAEWAGGGNG